MNMLSLPSQHLHTTSNLRNGLYVIKMVPHSTLVLAMYL